MTTIASTLLRIVLAIAVLTGVLLAQTETATVSGRITDETGALVPGANVQLRSIEHGSERETISDPSGLYSFTGIQPGQYHITVRKPGFRQIDVVGLVVNVQDHVDMNFKLRLGSVLESVTVTAGSSLVNTEDGSVSTVVDSQLAANLPMNGRSFQTLIELTPGVVLTPSNVLDSGQFSVNGQRSISNYWTVDGVSANFGVNSGSFLPGSNSAGTNAGFSIMGGTNSLVSADALQEFRIQTSSYAPEFGRTPGGQISIVTRSGTNGFHGTLFDYLRNDLFDASDWFNGYTNNPPLPKAKERQNDFGGTLGGPLIKDKTFFFFSYEGLRLRLPQTSISSVPDLAARQAAVPALQPYFNAYPFDPLQPDLGNGISQFNASFSNPGSLDAYSLRIDHRFTDRVIIFGRYNYSPSKFAPRGAAFTSLSTVEPTETTIQTATIGVTWSPTPNLNNDFHANYSSSNGRLRAVLDNFHGAVPLTSLPFPAPFTADNATFSFDIFSLGLVSLQVGQGPHHLQRQINLTDILSIQHGSHRLGFGVDYRRLAPVFDPLRYSQQASFVDVASAETGSIGSGFAYIASSIGSSLLFHNFGAFAQDTWRATPQLTITYGLRWDLDNPPSTANGPSLPAVTGFNLRDMSHLALAPEGTPPFHTTYSNFAPRVGIAYALSKKSAHQTVIRGGFGLFYDLVSSQAGQGYGFGTGYPFGAQNCCPQNIQFPFSPDVADPPPIVRPTGTVAGIYALDPNIQMPYTLEWNVAVERALGQDQAITASYVGASGKRLLQSMVLAAPSPTMSFPTLVANTGNSNYNALQVQFDRRLSRGIRALASYTWAHSIDTASAGSFANQGNFFVSGQSHLNRGSSDFDLRHSFSAALTYDIPRPSVAILDHLLNHWSIENIVQAHSAPPEDINYVFAFSQSALGGSTTNVRPDVVPGQPLYLHGRQYPGNTAFNPAAFTPPPADPNGIPLRQGDLGRNTLRTFGATQWDFAVHRDFPLHESIRLQFRAELFNILNHPNFGPETPTIDQGMFGIATTMLSHSLSDLQSSGLAPIYQIGGPRSTQLALKLLF